MRARPVVRAVSGGLTRRKVQTVVIFTVLLVSTASATLGLGLLLPSNSPFQHAFAAQRGAEVTASIDAARAAPGQLGGQQDVVQDGQVVQQVEELEDHADLLPPEPC